MGARISSSIIGVIALVALSAQAFADTSTSTTLACAARDVDLITSIEDHGNAGDVAADRLADAAFNMFQARDICGGGREKEALALYDRTLQGLAQTHASR